MDRENCFGVAISTDDPQFFQTTVDPTSVIVDWTYKYICITWDNDHSVVCWYRLMNVVHHSVICFLNVLAPTWWRLVETSFCSLTMPKSDSYRRVTSALRFRCLFLSGLLCFFDFVHLNWYYISDKRQTRYRFVLILWIYVRAFSTVHWSNLRRWINAFVLVESFGCMP